MSQKIQTVNVIEDADGAISVHSFHDNDEGNKEAEEAFFRVAQENGYVGSATNADEFCDDEGDCWEAGTYKVYIVHS
ncbi:MAG TPA: hypothetical protein PJ987_09500 [Bacteroidia bacterium]|nr:hypothetical protein [Bacteroidia bacterium]HMY42187.1 hypothetical protein [Chitinophagales bacterium]